MKYFGTFLLLLVMVGCTSSPASVTEKFSKAVALGKVDEAKKYCTESTGKVLDRAAEWGVLSIDPNYSIEIVGDSIVDNIAYVQYKENDSDRIHTMTLYKMDGEWKVNMKGK